MDETLPDVLRRWRGGDEAAFELLAEQIGRLVYPRALRAVGDHATADDITQEALLRVFRKAGDLDDPKAFAGWILRIAHNLILDHFRKRTRERELHEAFLELRRKQQRDRLSARERAELAEVLYNALDVLDEKHREVFILKEVEGLSHEQIALRLGVPEGTVWSRLSYARKDLRDRLTRRSGGLETPKQS